MVLSYVDKHEVIKQCKKKREESVSRLTATCDLLTAHCKINDSINIKIQMGSSEVVFRHALLNSRQTSCFYDIISGEKVKIGNI